ncbi:hypothetical protein BCR36DRAFT_335971 [Piromyces finnis]|uniref:Coth-domain-containing protein n=1 Tax=Piromyces finnis TaxID=1754191 RepID=A0A1Y1UYH2_9FUNG|nr:hypothetical protein BCR36DRAFT_335971 [Piromyces finnis]|eukprot:ORX43372.1 hypothetical protein BCR36DRAFT_335971 [Piromyces finnis]
MVSKNNDILYEFEYDGTPTQYYYEVTGTTQNESVLFQSQRQWDPSSTTTLYEVFGRRNTIGDSIIQTIPRLYPKLEGYDKYSQLFQEGEIPVINLHMEIADYNSLTQLSSNQDVEYKVSFDFYSPYEKLTFTNVTLGLSGQGSKGQEKKPYKFDLSEGDADKKNTKIFNRSQFKLRSIRYDESGIKNKLAGDIAESLGLPIAQSAPCRLYINNKSYGLYEIADMYKKSFLKRFFNIQKNTDGYVYGSLYKGVSGVYPAYFYSDIGNSRIQDLYESVVEPTGGYDPHQDINNMIAWAENLPLNAPLEEIEKQFDVDMFLKYCIIEYLICQWDGYNINGNNFFTYIEPNNGKYHFFSYDFDLTFGKWCKPGKGTFDDYIANVEDTKHQSYGPNPGKKNPILYDKIINNINIKPKFEEMIKDVVGNLFNIEALGPRIEYFHQFLIDDLYWDVFCYNIIQTQTFSNADVQNKPTTSVIEAQYSDTEVSTENLRAWVKYKAVDVQQAYGGIPSLKSDPRYGVVGGKIMSIGSSNEDDNASSNNTTSSGSSMSFTTSITLLFIIMSIVCSWIAN